MRGWLGSTAAWSSPSPPSPPYRTERLIAGGRVLLAVLSLLAIHLDPSEPAKFAGNASSLLVAYAVYASLLALAVWRSPAPLVSQRLATHVFDLAIFSVLMYLTGGPESPFFVGLVFSLMCAAIRWQRRGAVWTAVATLAILIALAVYAPGGMVHPAFKTNEFITRCIALVIVAALLGYLGEYEDRFRQELCKLAGWLHAVPSETSLMEKDLLQQTAAIFGAENAVMVWEEWEEPWLYLASWSGGEFRRTRETPGTFQPLVAEPLAGTDFLCPDVGAPSPRVLHTSPAGLKWWRGSPVHRDLQARFAAEGVLSLRLRGENWQGRLFFLGKREMTSDDLALGGIVARQVAAHLDQFFLVHRQRQLVVLEERIRLTRELHDGVIQSLSGTTMLLETVCGNLDAGDLTSARERLREIERLLGDEQRDLRLLFHELRPWTLDSPEEDTSLAARLTELSERFERVWGLPVELRLKELPPRLPPAMAYETTRIVRETLVNAARHAHASAVRVELHAQDDHLHLTVADNGRGFPFKGQYDQTALHRLRIGPVSLKERIASLGGSLTIDSTTAGARLDIRLPLREVEAQDGH